MGFDIYISIIYDHISFYIYLITLKKNVHIVGDQSKKIVMGFDFFWGFDISIIYDHI